MKHYKQERGLLTENSPAELAALVKNLDDIEHAVNRMKAPKSFGDQFYVLRQHINLVRERLLGNLIFKTGYDQAKRCCKYLMMSFDSYSH